MFHLHYTFDLPLDGRAVPAIAILAPDGAGRIGLVAIEIPQAQGFVRFNKGGKFDRAERYLRASCWQDVLLQFEIRKKEIAALADRFERFPATDKVDVVICATRAQQLRRIAAQAVM